MWEPQVCSRGNTGFAGSNTDPEVRGGAGKTDVRAMVAAKKMRERWFVEQSASTTRRGRSAEQLLE